MTNPVFEHYQDALLAEAMEKFRTYRTQSAAEDILDPEFSLITEAFDDVEVLLNYSNAIGRNSNISMKECGFIASHINSIENKYKDIVNFNIVASESQGSDFRAKLVSEALGKGAIAVLLGVISAILSFIIFWRKKNKTDVVVQVEKELNETQMFLDKITKLTETIPAEQVKAKSKFIFTSNSKFLQHYNTVSTSEANEMLDESAYKTAYESFERRLSMVSEIFQLSKLSTYGLTDAIKVFIKAVRSKNKNSRQKIDKALTSLNNLQESKGIDIAQKIRGYEFISYSEIKTNDILFGYQLKLIPSKLSMSKGPYDCTFSDVKQIRSFYEMCKKNEENKTFPWSTKGLMSNDLSGIGFGGNDISDLEKLIKDIDNETLKLEPEFKQFVIKTAKDLMNSFTVMTRQTIGITLAFRKEQNYATNFLRELAKQTLFRLEKLDNTKNWLKDKIKNGEISDAKTRREWSEKVLKEMDNPNINSIQV